MAPAECPGPDARFRRDIGRPGSRGVRRNCRARAQPHAEPHRRLGGMLAAAPLVHLRIGIGRRVGERETDLRIDRVVRAAALAAKSGAGQKLARSVVAERLRHPRRAARSAAALPRGGAAAFRRPRATHAGSGARPDRRLCRSASCSGRRRRRSRSPTRHRARRSARRCSADDARGSSGGCREILLRGPPPADPRLSSARRGRRAARSRKSAPRSVRRT